MTYVIGTIPTPHNHLPHLISSQTPNKTKSLITGSSKSGVGELDDSNKSRNSAYDSPTIALKSICAYPTAYLMSPLGYLMSIPNLKYPRSDP